jgi:hypothetical protein
MVVAGQIGRGDVFLVGPDSTRGDEIQKTRPCVILQRLFVITPQLGNGLGNVVALSTKRVDHSQAFALRSDEQAVMNLADDHRRQNRYLFRLFEKLSQAQECLQHVRIDIRDGNSLKGTISKPGRRRNLRCQLGCQEFIQIE